MKKKFLNSSMKLIKNNHNYSNEQLEIIEYGLEGLYLTITKAVFIFSLAILLGIFKEVILLLFTYNIIRSQAFGIHASKSLYCLISSTIIFIGGAILCKYMALPIWIMIIGSIICNVCLFLYAPADTYKRPIVNPRKRHRFKILSSLFGVIYTILIIVFNNNLSNYLFIGMFCSVVMILPITYKCFKLPYNNYKTYDCGV